MSGTAQLKPTETCRMQELDEKELVDRSKGGDMGAFDELFGRHRNVVVGAIRRILRNSPDCDDLAQDVYLKAFNAISQYQGRSKFSSWLHPIAVRTALDHIRDTRQNLQSQLEEERDAVHSADDDPGDCDARPNPRNSYSSYHIKQNHHFNREELREILRRVRAQLTSVEAEAMHMCHIEGHDATTVAERVGLKDAAHVYEITKKYSKLCREAKSELENQRVKVRAAKKSL